MDEMVRIDSSAKFNEFVSADGVAVVDFYADWCGPCKMQSPVMDELAGEAEDKYRVAKLNTDKCTNVCIKYRVASIPTVLIFKNGELVDKTVGFTEKTELYNIIAKYFE